VNITDLLLHPIRLRIVHAVRDGRPFTTSQLCERLPDVPKTTVYRHVGLLATGRVVEVESERRVRGAVERRYRLHLARTMVDPDTAASMSADDHRRGFAAATLALLAEFNAYLDREGADPVADRVSYRQFSLWLSNDEKAAFIEEVAAAIRARTFQGPSPERRQHMLSTILFPTATPT
jgi:DNA-binding transcriptional ArsR family regulator